MSNLREAAQDALAALNGVLDTYGEPLDKLSIAGGTFEALVCRDAITALRAALAQPEPEKVAWRFWVGDWQYVCDERMLHHLDKDVFFEPLYTMPPKQRKKIDLSPMQEAAQMLRDRAAKQRKDNGND